MIDDLMIALYWADIPVGRENAATYNELCARWDCDSRRARAKLHELSVYDNGDNYILIRSGGCNPPQRALKGA